MPYLNKIIAPFLIICFVGVIAGPILFLPLQTQAAYPVSIVADSDQPVETAWEIEDVIFEAGNIAENLHQTAVAVWDKAKKMLTWAIGKALNTLLHQLLNTLTNDIVDWIQNGGEPRFVSEGISSYLKDVADKAGGDFVENYLGLGWMCEPFDMEVKFALQEVPTFKEGVTCTLSDVVENIDDFYDNFSNGGWKAWVKLTEPKGNFYGGFLLAEMEKEKKEEEAKAQEEFDAEAGGGFLSMKTCSWYDKDGDLVEKQEDVIGQPSMPDSCNEDMLPCEVFCTNLTPSTLMDETAKKTSTNWLDQINQQIGAATAKAGPYSVYIQAIANALINRLMTEGVGFFRAGVEEYDKDYKKFEDKPDYGDLGAASSTPEIADPSDIEEEKNDATLLIGQLEILQSNLEDMTEDIEQRIENLEKAYDYYDIKTRAALRALEECKLEGYSKWASNKLKKIDDEILPGIKSEIESLEAYVSEATVQDIEDAIALTNNFIDKADEWLDVWEDVGGNTETDSDEDGTSDLDKAEEELDEAREAAIKKIQEVVTAFNGSYDSSDFDGLINEVKTAIKNLSDLSIELNVNPDDQSELENAKALEDEADRYGTNCANYLQMKKDIEEGLTEIKKAVEEIEVDVNVNITQ
jgi:hypothetical protein